MFVIVALREKVSSSSQEKSLIKVMLQGVDIAPGPLPAVNVTAHVVPTKSVPVPEPSIVHVLICYSFVNQAITGNSTPFSSKLTSLLVAVSPP